MHVKRHKQRDNPISKSLTVQTTSHFRVRTHPGLMFNPKMTTITIQQVSLWNKTHQKSWRNLEKIFKKKKSFFLFKKCWRILEENVKIFVPENCKIIFQEIPDLFSSRNWKVILQDFFVFELNFLLLLNERSKFSANSDWSLFRVHWLYLFLFLCFLI